MSVEQTTLKHPILHIRPKLSPQADNIDAALTASGIFPHTCTDVYRATARICSSPKDVLRVLIVCLDDFSSGEMEFFSLMRRDQPNLTILVHASSASSEFVQESLALGASDFVTQDSVAQTVGTVAEPCRLAEETSAVCDTPASAAANPSFNGPPDHKPTAKAPAVYDFTRPVTDRATTPPENPFDNDDIDETRLRLQPDHADETAHPLPSEQAAQADRPTQQEHSAPPARSAKTEPASRAKRPVQVPWLRRPNPPLRVAPPPGDAPESDAPPRRPPPAGAFAHEPLLSEAEIRALMDEQPEDGESDYPAEDAPHLTDGPEDGE